MSNDVKCMKCGSSNCALGKMRTTGGLSFLPEDSKFMSLQVGDAPVNGLMCLDCGFVELNGDVKKATSMIKE